ncbi:hypothetical protein Tco_0394386 [Tanacetum coccineum]
MGRLTGSRDKRTGRVVKSRSVMSKRVLCGDNNSQVVGDFGRDRGRGRESGKSRGQWRINTLELQFADGTNHLNRPHMGSSQQPRTSRG